MEIITLAFTILKREFSVSIRLYEDCFYGYRKLGPYRCSLDFYKLGVLLEFYDWSR